MTSFSFGVHRLLHIVLYFEISNCEPQCVAPPLMYDHAPWLHRPRPSLLHVLLDFKNINLLNSKTRRNWRPKDGVYVEMWQIHNEKLNYWLRTNRYMKLLFVFQRRKTHKDLRTQNTWKHQSEFNGGNSFLFSLTDRAVKEQFNIWSPGVG